MKRGFSLIEMLVVVAVAAVASTAGIMAISSFSKNKKRTEALNGIYEEVQRQRAAHLARGGAVPLVICVDCVDEGGVAHATVDRAELDVFLGNAEDLASGPLLFSRRFEDVRLGGGCAGRHIFLDALGRAFCPTFSGNPDEPPMTPGFEDLQLGITVNDEDEEFITFSGEGRVFATFSNVVLPAPPPRAQNLSARFTPDPMPIGQFDGNIEEAIAVPLH